MLNMVCHVGPVPIPSIDGRRHKRRSVVMSAAMRTTAHGRFAAVLQDLSISGCRLVTSKSMQIGERVFVRLPGFQPFVGEVRWIGDKEAGIRFDVPLHPAVVEHISQASPLR
ncbi:PilZ domain-containing protein [Sphingomonas sp. CJ99]